MLWQLVFCGKSVARAGYKARLEFGFVVGLWAWREARNTVFVLLVSAFEEMLRTVVNFKVLGFVLCFFCPFAVPILVSSVLTDFILVSERNAKLATYVASKSDCLLLPYLCISAHFK